MGVVNAPCCGGEQDIYEVDVFNLKTKAFEKSDLSQAPIEIGENGFTALMRDALLQENFTLINNKATAANRCFELLAILKTHGNKIVRLQAALRSYIT